MRKLTEEFFDNKSEQNKIKSAIHQAIPEGILYHNLVIVLSEIIKDMVWEMTKEDVFKKSHRPTQRAADVGTEWACSKCGTTNMLDVPICQACFHPRG
jgi:hypothetical protein